MNEIQKDMFFSSVERCLSHQQPDLFWKGKKLHVEKKLKRNKGETNRFVFDTVDKGGFIEHILNPLNACARESGYHFRSDSVRNYSQKKTGTFVTYRKLMCSCSKKKTKSRSGKRTRKTRSKRISDCTAYLSFQFSEETGWILVNMDLNHKGHFVNNNLPCDVSSSLKTEVMKKLNDDLISPAACIASVARTEGVRLTSKQAYNLCGRVETERREEKRINNIVNASQSGQLISDLDKDISVTYVACYSRIENGQTTGTIYAKKLAGQEGRCFVLNPVDGTINTDAEVLQLHKGNLQLESVSWATTFQLDNCKRYPDILVLDATSKTNSQNRPLVLCTGMDGENKATKIMTSLLRSESRSSFHFVLFISLLGIYGAEFTKSICLLLSDGDPQITDVIDELIRNKYFSDGAKRRRCFWHCKTQFLLKTIPGGDPKLKFVRDILQQWFQRCRQASTKDLLNQTAKSMLEWLKSLKDTRFITGPQFELVQSKAQEVLQIASLWANCFFTDTATFDKNTTSSGEGMNNAMKKTSAVNSRCSLIRVSKADRNASEIRDHDRKVEASRINQTEPLEPRIASLQEGHLTKYALSLLHKEHEKSLLYEVKVFNANGQMCWQVRLPRQSDQDEIHFIDGDLQLTVQFPTLARCHLLCLNDDGGLVCDCLFPQNMLLPCRHIMAVNKQHVDLTDCHIRWTALYQLGHIPRDPDFSLFTFPSLKVEYKLPAEAASEASANVDISAGMDLDDYVANDTIDGIGVVSTGDQADEDDSVEDDDVGEVNVSEIRFSKGVKKIRYLRMHMVVNTLLQNLTSNVFPHAAQSEDLTEWVVQKTEEFSMELLQEFDKLVRSRMPHNSLNGPIIDAPYVPTTGRASSKRQKASYEQNTKKRKTTTAAMLPGPPVSLPEKTSICSPPPINRKGRPSKFTNQQVDRCPDCSDSHLPECVYRQRVQCSGRCNRWFHADCVGFSKHARNTQWLCKHCPPLSDDMTQSTALTVNDFMVQNGVQRNQDHHLKTPGAVYAWYWKKLPKVLRESEIKQLIDQESKNPDKIKLGDRVYVIHAATLAATGTVTWVHEQLIAVLNIETLDEDVCKAGLPEILLDGSSTSAGISNRNEMSNSEAIPSWFRRESIVRLATVLERPYID